MPIIGDRLFEPKNQIKIEVRDTGIGISNIDNIGTWFHKLEIVNGVN